MKFTIYDLRTKIADVKTLWGLHFEQDLIINKDLEIYMKVRPEGKSKAHCLPNERCLIKGWYLGEEFMKVVLADATCHIFAINDVTFKAKPEKFNNPKDKDFYESAKKAFDIEYEQYQAKYATEIKARAIEVKRELLATKVSEITTNDLRQILWSFGYKDADDITSIDNPTSN